MERAIFEIMLSNVSSLNTPVILQFAKSSSLNSIGTSNIWLSSLNTIAKLICRYVNVFLAQKSVFTLSLGLRSILSLCRRMAFFVSFQDNGNIRIGFGGKLNAASFYR